MSSLGKEFARIDFCVASFLKHAYNTCDVDTYNDVAESWNLFRKNMLAACGYEVALGSIEELIEENRGN